MYICVSTAVIILAQLIKVDIAAAIQNLHIHTPTQYYSIDTHTYSQNYSNMHS